MARFRRVTAYQQIALQDGWQLLISRMNLAYASMAYRFSVEGHAGRLWIWSRLRLLSRNMPKPCRLLVLH